MSANRDTSPAAVAHLRRSFTLWHVILYGIVVIQPTAPMPLFGVLSDSGRGHAVTTILIAMIAMLFTAMSYRQMARAYPSAGSAFTYVRARTQSCLWIRDGLEHDDGLCAQPDWPVVLPIST
jgi:amino acid transporter